MEVAKDLNLSAKVSNQDTHRFDSIKKEEKYPREGVTSGMTSHNQNVDEEFEDASEIENINDQSNSKFENRISSSP